MIGGAPLKHLFSLEGYEVPTEIRFAFHGATWELLRGCAHTQHAAGGQTQAAVEMASYWVSQERYFCKYCKVWLSNHKAVSAVSRRSVFNFRKYRA